MRPTPLGRSSQAAKADGTCPRASALDHGPAGQHHQAVSRSDHKPFGLPGFGRISPTNSRSEARHRPSSAQLGPSWRASRHWARPPPASGRQPTGGITLNQAEEGHPLGSRSGQLTAPPLPAGDPQPHAQELELQQRATPLQCSRALKNSSTPPRRPLRNCSAPSCIWISNWADSPCSRTPENWDAWCFPFGQTCSNCQHPADPPAESRSLRPEREPLRPATPWP